MNTKKCSHCKQEKDFSEFHKCKTLPFGLTRPCKDCSKEQKNRYYQSHKEQFSKKGHEYYQKNKLEIYNRNKIYKSKNKEKCKQYQKEWSRKRRKSANYIDWQKTHLERSREIKRLSAAKRRKENPQKYREYKKKRRSSVGIKLNDILSCSVRRVLNGRKAGRSWHEILGYSADELKVHIERQFKRKWNIGMTWENYGEWQIDHIIPVSFFKFNSPDDVEFKMCWRLQNLQPMWKLDNIRKSNKLPRALPYPDGTPDEIKQSCVRYTIPS